MQLRLVVGGAVTAPRVIAFVRRHAHMREECGMISNIEAVEMVKQTEEKLKQLMLL